MVAAFQKRVEAFIATTPRAFRGHVTPYGEGRIAHFRAPDQRFMPLAISWTHAGVMVCYGGMFCVDYDDLDAHADQALAMAAAVRDGHTRSLLTEPWGRGRAWFDLRPYGFGKVVKLTTANISYSYFWYLPKTGLGAQFKRRVHPAWSEAAVSGELFTIRKLAA